MLRALALCLSILTVAETGRATAQQAAAPSQQPTFWCPMHPDERASSAIACPVCRMTMVPIPSMRVGEYRMDVVPLAAPSGRGLRGLRVTLREPDSGAVVPALDRVHEKPLHLFVVSRDLEFFRHVHPETYTRGPIEFRLDVPPGEYMVIADFLPSGGTPQLIQRLVIAPGAGAQVAKTAVVPATVGIAGGVRALFHPTVDLTSGRESKLRITLTNAADGRPIQDLEPYLGAAAHMMIVNHSLTTAVHGHPADGDNRDGDGVVLFFDVTFPEPGVYRAWLQFQRAGTVVTIPLGLTVR